MIFLVTTGLYLAFAGTVLWYRHLCTEGAWILLFGGCVVLGMAVIATNILQPEDPNSFHAVCLRSGGQLIHTTLEVKNTSAQVATHIVEDCKR